MSRFKYIKRLGWAVVLIPIISITATIWISYEHAAEKKLNRELLKLEAANKDTAKVKALNLQNKVDNTKVHTQVEPVQEPKKKYETPKNQTIKSGRDTVQPERVDTASN